MKLLIYLFATAVSCSILACSFQIYNTLHPNDIFPHWARMIVYFANGGICYWWVWGKDKENDM